MAEKDFIATGNGYVIPLGNICGVEIHETISVDRYGNIYGGHTTSNLKDNHKLRISTDPLIARSDSSFNER